VAGYERVPAPAAIAALDPTAAPGISSGGASASVAGPIVVNATASPAIVAGGPIAAAQYRIVGPSVTGVLSAYPGTTGRLSLDSIPLSDPLIHLPTPASAPSAAGATATPQGQSWNTQALGSPSVTDAGATGLLAPNAVDASGSVQLYPGVYDSISITGGSVTFNPGVYILSATDGSGYSLDITGGNVTGSGVMFYNTGADFVPGTGYPDSADRGLYDPGPSGTNAPWASSVGQDSFGAIRLDSSMGAQINFSPLDDDRGSFDGMLIYQRRANAQTITLVGGNLSLAGTVYAKWAPLSFSGGGTYPVQMIVGSVQLSGTATLNITAARAVARADEVFLVE
jgi:hypothetical protein